MISFRQGSTSYVYTDEEVKEVLSKIRDFSDLLIKKQFNQFYEELWARFNSDTAFYNAWPLIMYILLSDDVGFTVDYILQYLDHIPSWFFSYLPENINRMIIPKNIYRIDNDAFINCDNLVAIKFEGGDAPTYLSSTAFRGCPNLMVLQLAKNVYGANKIIERLDEPLIIKIPRDYSQHRLIDIQGAIMNYGKGKLVTLEYIG